MLKNRTRIGSAIDTDLYNQLKDLSKKTRIPISKLLDEALEDLLKKHKS
ncbi:MAG: ribbon-helix-helix domain-containing protein [Clostridium sp.]|nr:ribbon-helix-helix domain-containing protein [Clostridium sp.]MCE5221926.1 ribbon-helix-helix domain-containing protein [Clostridium sp.]